MVTFLIIIGRVPAIMRFRGIFFSQKVIFIDLLKIKCRAKEKSDFDENDIFDRFKVWENRLCVTICAFIHLEIGYPSSASSGIQILHGSIALAKEQ